MAIFKGNRGSLFPFPQIANGWRTNVSRPKPKTVRNYFSAPVHFLHSSAPPRRALVASYRRPRPESTSSSKHLPVPLFPPGRRIKGEERSVGRRCIEADSSRRRPGAPARGSASASRWRGLRIRLRGVSTAAVRRSGLARESSRRCPAPVVDPPPCPRVGCPTVSPLW
jgi:hypothetical protein